MSKLPQYGIFENPMDGRVFLMQTRPFMLIAAVYHFEAEQEEAYMDTKRQITVGSTVEYQGELVLLEAVYVPDQQGTAQEVADRLAKVMRKMGDWYYSYLKWEDDQIDKEKERG